MKSQQERKCVEYLANKWFQYREHFVLAWTNWIKHHDNNTTNRAEGLHGKLKIHLDSSQESFPIMFRTMNNILNNQLIEIKNTFENSLGLTKLFPNGMPYRELMGRIFHLALELIRRESDRSIEEVGLDLSKCDHVLRTIYGLPYTHELLEYRCENRPIPLKAVDQYWGKLTVLPNSCEYLIL